MLDFSRTSKYGIIDNNLLNFYNTISFEEKETEEKHGDGIIDTVISGLKKLKKPIIEGTKEIVKGAAKEGFQQLGSFGLRKIVDKVTSKKPVAKNRDDDDNEFITEEDINAKARRKILKDLQIHPITTEKSDPENNIDKIKNSLINTKNLLDEELKKILNITTPKMKFGIRIGE